MLRDISLNAFYENNEDTSVTLHMETAAPVHNLYIFWLNCGSGYV